MDYSLTHGIANAQQRFPDEVDVLEQLGRENIAEIEKVIREYNIDCDFERNGAIEVASTWHPENYTDELKEDYSSNNSCKKILMPLNKNEEHSKNKEFIKKIGISKNQHGKISSNEKNQNHPSNDSCGKEIIFMKKEKEENIKIIPKKILDHQKIQNQKNINHVNSTNKNSKQIFESNVRNKNENIVSKKEQNVISTNLPESGNERGKKYL